MIMNNTGHDDRWSYKIWDELLKASEKALKLRPDMLVKVNDQLVVVKSYVYLDGNYAAVIDVQDINGSEIRVVDPSQIELIDQLSALAEQA